MTLSAFPSSCMLSPVCYKAQCSNVYGSLAAPVNISPVMDRFQGYTTGKYRRISRSQAARNAS